MRCALDVIRVSITAPAFLRQPVRVYAIGTRSGREGEAEMAPEYMMDLSPRGLAAISVAADLDPLARVAVQA